MIKHNNPNGFDFLTNKKMIVSVIENNFMPELKSYGPLYNANLPVCKIVSLINRGVIVRFSKKSDLHAIEDYIAKYNEAADKAESIDVSINIRRPDKAESEIKKAIAMANRTLGITDEKTTSVFDTSDSERSISELARYFEEDGVVTTMSQSTNQQSEEFRKRIKFVRGLTNVSAFVKNDDDFDGIEFK